MDDRAAWLASLKVGDEVAIAQPDLVCGMYYVIRRVTDVTPERCFRVTGYLFYTDEHGYISKLGESIDPVTDAVYIANARHYAVRELRAFSGRSINSWNDVSTDDLLAMAEIARRYLEGDRA